MVPRKPWSIEVTRSPKCSMGERSDRPGIWVFWWNPARGKAGVRDKIRWPLQVRDSDGHLDRALVRKADLELERIHAALVEGIDPRALREADRASGPERDDPRMLTIEEGFRMFFDRVDGAYAAQTKDVKELKRYRALIERFVGYGTTWSTLDARAGTLLSRALADHYPGDTGFRSSARAVDLLFRCADWLRSLRRIPVDACLRPSDWAATMRREWRDMGKKVRPSRPRFSQDELQTLLQSTDKADPRIRRAFAIGPEYRAANLRRVMRSHLDLDRIGLWGLGRLTLPGTGNKRGAVIDVDPALRERLDYDLEHGDLAHHEARYRRKQVSDYALMPTRGKATPIRKRHFADLFAKYETAAGVDHEEGRGWNGLRRAMSDAMDETTDDQMVRNQSGAWAAGSSTRDRTYRDAGDPRLLARTRQAQMKTRRRILGADPQTEELRQEAHVLLDEAGREHLEAVLATLKTPKLTPRLTPEKKGNHA